MSPEELFEKNKVLAEATVFKMFNNPRKVAKDKRMELNDLYQYAYMGLWVACNNWDESKAKFNTHAINNIKWSIMRGLDNDDNYKRCKYKPNSKENDVKMEYLDNAPKEDGITYHEILPDKTDIFSDAHSNIVAPKLLEGITPKQKEAVLLKAQGYNCQEIGKMLGMSRENARQLIARASKTAKKSRDKLVGVR